MSTTKDDVRARLSKGDVLRINDHFQKFAVVSRPGPDPWVVSPDSGAEFRVRALADWSETRFDAILGVDSADAFHVHDWSASEVVIYERTDDYRTLYELKTQSVRKDQATEYVRWLETDSGRTWDRETLPERFQDVLDAGGEADGE